MNELREALRRAIEARRAAAAKACDAETLAKRAAKFVAALEGEVAGFAEIDAKIASERAQAVREAFSEGRSPTFSNSDALQSAIIARADAENRLAAARAAQAELDNEAAKATAAERAAKGEVYEAARSVAVAEADAIADELADVEARALELRVKLHAADRVWMPRRDGAGGPPSPIPLTRKAVKLIRAAAMPAQAQLEVWPAKGALARLGDVWREHAAALHEDADAVLGDDPGEPQEPARQAAAE